MDREEFWQIKMDKIFCNTISDNINLFEKHSLIDNFEKLKKSYNNQYFLIDILPQTMKDQTIYFKYFDKGKNTTIDRNYCTALKKIIHMLLGYNQINSENFPVFIESSLFHDNEEIKRLNIDLNHFSFFYQKAKVKILSASNLDDFDILLDYAINSKISLLVFFSRLQTILYVNELYTECITLSSFELIQKIVEVEGLYFYKKSTTD